MNNNTSSQLLCNISIYSTHNILFLFYNIDVPTAFMVLLQLDFIYTIRPILYFYYLSMLLLVYDFVIKILSLVITMNLIKLLYIPVTIT